MKWNNQRHRINKDLKLGISLLRRGRRKVTVKPIRWIIISLKLVKVFVSLRVNGLPIATEAFHSFVRSFYYLRNVPVIYEVIIGFRRDTISLLLLGYTIQFQWKRSVALLSHFPGNMYAALREFPFKWHINRETGDSDREVRMPCLTYNALRSDITFTAIQWRFAVVRIDGFGWIAAKVLKIEGNEYYTILYKLSQ